MILRRINSRKVHNLVCNENDLKPEYAMALTMETSCLN